MMTRSQKLRALALGILAKRPVDFGYPEDTLVGEIILYAGDEQRPAPMEVRAEIDKLVEEGCTARTVNSILGSVYYTLTDKGRANAPQF